MSRKYILLNNNGYYNSIKPGLFGGHKKQKIYGKLDCSTALRAIANGWYVKYRVFFATEQDAINAGYHPCGNCMREKYKKWKEVNE